ncbi:MAG: hypothetical protein ACI8QC_002609 [Planctomycetota bacterium]|jgi:hypothetical protein
MQIDRRTFLASFTLGLAALAPPAFISSAFNDSQDDSDQLG